MRFPRIGITGSVAPHRIGTRRTFLNEPYVTAIGEAGGVPLVVTPAHTGPGLRELYDLFDGLVLTGGEDVEPTRYGDVTVHPTVETVPERDAMEFALLDWALADRLPLLAICRGIQVLNVGLGGTLHQDLPSERPGAVLHDQTKADPPIARTQASHPVTVTAGSRLEDVIGPGPHRVNSMHHQGLRALPGRLVAVAHAPDGLIEAVEGAPALGEAFLLGVQWHPEELARGGDPASRRLFEAFALACAKRQR